MHVGISSVASQTQEVALFWPDYVAT